MSAIFMFSYQLQSAMKMRGMTKADLAEKTEIGIHTINEYAHAKALPNKKTLPLLASALGVTEAWLVAYNITIIKEQDCTQTAEDWERRHEYAPQ